MSRSQEKFISLIVALKDAVAAITVAYQRMPAIVDEEHKAISESNLDRIEVICSEKMRIGSALEFQFRQLRQICEKISELHVTATGSTSKHDSANLSTSFSEIEAIAEKFSQIPSDGQMIQNSLSNLRDQFEHFVAARDAAQTRVDTNRLVLGKVLANRQENYRFWQEVSADLMAAYNREGKQRAPRSKSILNVKA